MSYQSRAIFYPILTNTHGVDDKEDTFKFLQIVKGAALKNGLTSLITVDREGPVGETWKQMLRYIFDNCRLKMIKIGTNKPQKPPPKENS